MQDAIERLFLLPRRDEKVFKNSPISQFSFHEINALGEEVAASMAEIVEDYSPVAARSEEPSHSSADIPCPAGNQNFHKK